MEDKEIKSNLEALLFIAGDPLPLKTIKNILDTDAQDIERIAKELIHEYHLKHSGILIQEVAGGIQMVTNPACAPWVKKLLATAIPTKLSNQSLETLAIVAYRQPIIKAEIESIRGVNSDGVLRTLLERRLIKILGRKEAPGRPLMYGTTKEFLHYFGLKDLSELPTLKEFSELEGADADLSPGDIQGRAGSDPVIHSEGAGDVKSEVLSSEGYQGDPEDT